MNVMYVSSKGGLISESFSHWLQSPKKGLVFGTLFGRLEISEVIRDLTANNIGQILGTLGRIGDIGQTYGILGRY